MPDTALRKRMAANVDRPAPAQAFGVTIVPGSSQPDYGRFYGYRLLGDFWDDLTGKTAKVAAERLTRRAHHLEHVIADLLRALDTHFLAEMEATLEPIETQMEALRQTQIETGKLLHQSVENAERTTSRAIAAVEALRSDLDRTVARLEARLDTDLAALPAQWRADIARTIDDLRQSADGANALLLGAESLAGSVARSIEDFDHGTLS